MKKYTIISEIRQNIKGDYCLNYQINRNGIWTENKKLPKKLIDLVHKINPICNEYSKTFEEIKIRKDKFDKIIASVCPNKIVNTRLDWRFNIIESYVFSV